MQTVASYESSSRPTLPYSQEAEESVIGGILLHPMTFNKVAEFLHPDDFYHPALRAIYEAMVECERASKPIDALTVSEQMKALETLDKLRAVNGSDYFIELQSKVFSVENIEYHARMIRGKATARRLVQACSSIAAKGYGEYGDVDEYIDTAEREIFEIAQRSQKGSFEKIDKVLKEAIKALAARFERKQAITGVPTTFHKFDEMTAGLQPGDLVIVAARPSMGKCLTARTLIDDPETGRRLTIEECVQRRLPHVLNLSDEGQVRVAKVAAWVDSGVKPCFRVRTRTGREVEVTGHHPFLTVEGWKPLHDLAVGSSIAVPTQTPVFGTQDLPRGLVRLLAYFIAEGGLTGSSPRFTSTDPELIADFRAAIETHFPTCHINQYGIDYAVADGPRGGRKPNPVTEWLREQGLWGKKSEAKRLPPCVWTLPRPALAELLRVLMSCDGTIYAMGGYPRIEFTVASDALAEDVQHAFLRLGVVSKRWRKTERSWRVEITDPDAVAAYQREIGWIGEKTRRFTGELAEGRRSNCGHAPVETWTLVRTACERAGLSLVELARQSGETDAAGKLGGYNPHANRGIPRQRLAGYAKVLDDPSLRRAASADVYWDEIVEITAIGEQQVYDLTVPDGSNFIAQDVFVHNTSFIMNAVQNASVKHQIPALVFSLEMSKVSLGERLLSSQARVDSAKLRRGMLDQRDWVLLTKAASDIAEAPIYIDDSGSPTLLEIRAKCRRWRADPKIFPPSKPEQLGMVVIDYMQLIQGRASKDDNRQREISEISRGLKSLAKEMKVPIVALSQLNRGLENREDKRPKMADLRESGAIEQDADLICFIYRDEVYSKDQCKEEDKGVAEIIIGKQRNGPTGTVRLAFLNTYTRFENLAEGRDFVES